MTRPPIAKYLLQHLPVNMVTNIHPQKNQQNPFHNSSDQSNAPGSNTFEGEFERKDEDHKKIK